MPGQPQNGRPMPEPGPSRGGLPVADDQNQQQPGTASNFSWSTDSPRVMTLKFLFCNDHSTEWRNQDWVGIIQVKSDSFAQSDGKGFFWSSANILHERVFLGEDVPDGDFRQDEEEWSGARCYFLKDLQIPPRWFAKLRVYILHYEALCHFDVNCLSLEKIRFGEAFCPYWCRIYQYSHGNFQPCGYATHGNLPLPRTSPWPKITGVGISGPGHV